MAAIHLENRISAVEAEVARLKAIEEEIVERKARVAGSIAPTNSWWKEIAGIFAGDSDFLEVMRLGREYRESLRSNPREPRKHTGKQRQKVR